MLFLVVSTLKLILIFLYLIICFKEYRILSKNSRNLHYNTEHEIDPKSTKNKIIFMGIICISMTLVSFRYFLFLIPIFYFAAILLLKKYKKIEIKTHKKEILLYIISPLFITLLTNIAIIIVRNHHFYTTKLGFIDQSIIEIAIYLSAIIAFVIIYYIIILCGYLLFTFYNLILFLLKDKKDKKEMNIIKSVSFLDPYPFFYLFLALRFLI